LLTRYGHLVRLKEHHLARAQSFFARHGAKTVFLARFVAVLRTLSSLLAGVNRMPYRRFVAWNAAGGTLWAVVIGLLGAASGSQWDHLERWIGRAGLLVAGVLLLIALGAFAWRWGVRHEAYLRSRWEPLRARLAPFLGFVEARFSPRGYLGLQLTVGLAIILFGGWFFGGVAKDVLTDAPLVRVDETVSTFLHAHTAAPFTVAMRAVSAIGSPFVVLAAGVALALLFGWRRRGSDVGMIVLAVVGGELLNPLLKLIFARQRPTFEDPLVALASYSFPSGHAAGSTVFYGLLAYLVAREARSWGLRVLAVVAAAVTLLLIGFSRVYLGVHYLSDVLGGYAAGLVWLTSTVTGVELLRRRRELLEPPAGPAIPTPPVEPTAAASGSATSSRRTSAR